MGTASGPLAVALDRLAADGEPVPVVLHVAAMSFGGSISQLVA